VEVGFEFFEAVAVATDVEHVAGVEKAVEDGRRDDFIVYCSGISGIALCGLRPSAEPLQERRVAASRSMSWAAGPGRGRELRATMT
jgi:hypothetical protein